MSSDVISLNVRNQMNSKWSWNLAIYVANRTNMKFCYLGKVSKIKILEISNQSVEGGVYDILLLDLVLGVVHLALGL